ncbi:hypothetical protein A8F94_02620 [Bacillus sp. FJAT-27225]|uniref:fluoride efflux transporter FluC n=1 Tax=Bacillus sp. FJAT-27225 TaxID=1743144 RepID=UPI00080C2DE8|nr:CrcB family protein [Bacillus sp. FJAT-27225]OCA90787.1 hypothetical protein A8F94_02620 [Bacillus sp. FJAT-27225]
MTYLAVAAGGFLGAMARFFVSKLLNSKDTNRIPFGTMLVNLIGSFLLGYLIGKAVDGNSYAFAGIGFTGAFTTFSTFMLELHGMKKSLNSFVYAILSLAAGLALVLAGMIIGRI